MESAIDPISILILCAANGFTRDIVPCASLSRDADLWSYLAKEPFGLTDTTWLHAAAALGHVERICFLCDVGAPIEAVTKRTKAAPAYNACGLTALHFACKSNNPTAISMLADCGAAVDVVDDWGYAPLHICAQFNHLAASRVLLQNAANTNLTTPAGDTALHLVFYSPLDSSETIALLLKNDANVNAPTLEGWTPLHTAVFNGSSAKNSVPHAVKLLIEHGADVKARTKGGLKTALHFAVFLPAEISTILLDAGAEVNARDDLDRTPYSDAMYRSDETAAVLLARGGTL